MGHHMQHLKGKSGALTSKRELHWLHSSSQFPALADKNGIYKITVCKSSHMVVDVVTRLKKLEAGYWSPNVLTRAKDFYAPPAGFPNVGEVMDETIKYTDGPAESEVDFNGWTC